MSLAVPQSRLSDAYDLLLVQWSHAKETWRDDARQHFEDDFLEPIAPAVKQALSAMSSMGEHISTARHMCQ